MTDNYFVFLSTLTFPPITWRPVPRLITNWKKFKKENMDFREYWL